jgi:diguanylate cyclase (GGDEF)-like protein
MRARSQFLRLLQSLGVERADDDLAREQFRQLAQQMPLLYSVVLVNSLFLAAAIAPYVGVALALIFPSISATALVIRGGGWHRLARDYSENESIIVVRKALRGCIIAANVMALILGSFALWILQILPPQHLAFVPLFAILSMITCTYCLMSLPAAAYSIITTGTGIIVLGMITTRNPMLMAMAGNIAVVSVLIVYMVSRYSHQLRRIVASRSALTAQQEKTHELAYQDQLTKLPNRRALMAALQRQAQDNARSSVALALLDLNGFKSVNDTYGHATGDILLSIIGERLKSVVGTCGLVSRLGGDEFAIHFYDAENIGEMYVLIEELQNKLSDSAIVNNHRLSVGASFGLAVCEQMPDDPMELIRRADIALYEAKKQHHQAISLYEQAMDDKVQRSAIIEQALADPETLSAITLNYQPIFQTAGAQHVGFEALARWEHPVLGTIHPQEFIEVAERTGHIVNLTLHLFDLALTTAKRWPENTGLSFNLSASGLATSGLNRTLPAIMKKHGFDPGRLALEVTETALMRDKLGARNMLEYLQKMGIRIVLDDFGAGHASIGYLRNIRFDGIKLDGSLVNDILHNANARELLIGVLHLCKAIGATVTAEMIESEAQLDLLRPMKVDFVQGYLLGEPVPAEDTFEPDHFKQANRVRLLSANN